MNLKGGYLGLGIMSFILMQLIITKNIFIGLTLGSFGIFDFFMAFKEDK